MRADVSVLALVTAMACGAPVLAQEAPAETEEVVVVGQRAAIARAQDLERKADNLVNVVAADDIGQFADQNVAEALQRVPGVSLDRSEGEGRYISVRGLPSSYTPVTVNGVRLGTSDLGSAEVALDSLGSDQLSSIEVSKNVLPDQDADAIGGTVNLTTASAFTRGARRLQVRAEGYYNEFADKWGPEVAVNFSKLFLNDTLGVAGSLSYSKRDIEGDDLQSTQNPAFRSGPGGRFLRLEEIDLRREVGERTRFNASLNLEYRPSDVAQWFLRTTFSQLEDNDVQYQNEWEIRRGTTSAEILAMRETGGRFDDIEIDKQLFVRESTDRVYSVSAGGLYEPNEWRFDYRLDYALSEYDQPVSFRGRFQIVDIIADFDADIDSVTIRGFKGARGQANDPRDPSKYIFNQVLVEPVKREDEVVTGSFDATRQLEWFGAEDFLKFGLRQRVRDKVVDTEQVQGNRDFGVTLAGVPLVSVRSFLDDDPSLRFFPEKDAVLQLFRSTAAGLAGDPLARRADNSLINDYAISEDTTAAYAMASVNPTDRLRVIAGVRVERTKAGGTGFFVEYDSDNGLGAGGGPATIIALPEREREYTEWFPGLHVRWEPSSNIIVRGSYNRALQRPDFDERANRIRVSFDASNPVATRELEAGNPNLKPLIADQFDVSVAWYPSRDIALQATAFHKDIKDFFYDFEGDDGDFGQLGIALPTGAIRGVFDEVAATLNGAEATVSGVELSYTQSYTFLPGPLSGLFAQANVTFVESEATTEPGSNVKLPLPEQPDVVGNLSLGWENDKFSIRVAGNYRDKVLQTVNFSNPERTRYSAAYETIDVNLRYNVTPSIQVYFDAANLGEEADVEYYQGATIPLVRQAEYYGRTFQLGVRASF